MGHIEYTSCAMGKRTESAIFGACKIYPGAVSLFGVIDGGPPAKQNCPTESFTPKPPPLSHFCCGNKFTNYNIYRIFNRLCTFLTVSYCWKTYLPEQALEYQLKFKKQTESLILKKGTLTTRNVKKHSYKKRRWNINWNLKKKKTQECWYPRKENLP